MKHRELKIGRWNVDFLFAVKKYDIDEVIDALRSLDAPEGILEIVYDMMASKRMNTGFTYTDKEMFRALVVVGPASSSEEFIDTLTHEIHHLAVAIASVLGIDLESETPAYLAGDSMRELAELLCEMGCPHCNNEK